jgi:hypothetical protein
MQDLYQHVDHMKSYSFRKYSQKPFQQSVTSFAIPFFSQLTGTTLLMFLNLVQLIIQLVDYKSETNESPTSPMVASAVLVVTFAIAGACGYVNKKMGVISSGFLFIFWFLVNILSSVNSASYECIKLSK